MKAIRHVYGMRLQIMDFRKRGVRECWRQSEEGEVALNDRHNRTWTTRGSVFLISLPAFILFHEANKIILTVSLANMAALLDCVRRFLPKYASYECSNFVASGVLASQLVVPYVGANDFIGLTYAVLAQDV
jgi:hypothetical protein